MKILITGATGYLGQAVSKFLIEREEKVVALVRPTSQPAVLPAGIQVVRGDLLDAGSLDLAMEGCSCVIHLAGLVKRWVPDFSRFRQVNVEGLKTILEVANRHKVNRFLYASSIVALGPTDGKTGDETWSHSGTGFLTEYEHTKVEADLIARERGRSGFPIVLLYPGVLYGPGPRTEGNMMYRVLHDCLRGAFPGYPGKGDRRICYAYLQDVARGFHLALRNGRRGERYILGGENLTFLEFLDCLENVARISIRRRGIPFWVAEWMGRLQRWRARFLGIPPTITDGEVRVYRHDWAYSSDKARDEIGYNITPIKEGLRATVEWLRADGGTAAVAGN